MSPGKKKRKGHHPKKSKSASLSSSTDEFLGFSSMSAESSDDDNFQSIPDEVKNMDGNKTDDNKDIMNDPKVTEDVKEIMNGPKDKDELTCNICQESFDINTVNIDHTMFLNIKSSEPFGTRWHCPVCRKNPSTMCFELYEFKKVMQEELRKITQNFDEKFQNLETSIKSKVPRCEKPTTDTAETGRSYVETLRKNLKVQAEKTKTKMLATKTVQQTTTPATTKSVQQTTAANTTKTAQQPKTPDITAPPSTDDTALEHVDPEELRQRERKRLNVVLYSLPESKNVNESVAYQDDMLKLKDVLFKKEGFKPEHVKRANRIGEKSNNNVRPVRIIFTDMTTRSNVLSMTDLIYEDGSDTTKLYVSEDRTKMQLTQHKLLVEELKMRKEAGESDLTIRNGSIVKKRPFRPTPQSVWANPAQSEAQTPTSTATVET